MKPQEKEEINKFKKIIEEIKTGMLFTHSAKDGFNGRPMTTAKVDENCNLWFFTSEYNNHFHQICKNNQVYVNYRNSETDTCTVVTGKAFLTRDINRINEMYTPVIKNWFPGGINDPGLLLIRVEPTDIEYWSNDNYKIEHSSITAKSSVTYQENRRITGKALAY